MSNEVNEKETEKKMDVKKEILSWVFYLGFVMIVTYLIIHFVGQRTMVEGRSMENTLQNGDNLIVEKLSYRFGDPERFDIIIFKFPDDESQKYIKRIIGLPGETIEYVDGNILIDGEVLEEEYDTTEIEELGLLEDAITLDSDEYFVLGDDRQSSEDSRMANVGNVKRSEIEGKVWIIVSPSEHFGTVK